MHTSLTRGDTIKAEENKEIGVEGVFFRNFEFEGEGNGENER